MNDDEWNYGFETFEADRPRDPAWLTEELHERGRYTECDACYDQARATVEIPRVRMVGVRRDELPPARLHLCKHHALTTHSNDPDARIYWMDQD